MSRHRHHQVGEIIRGDHVILAVHEGYLGIVYICKQQLPNGKFIYKAVKTFKDADNEVCRGLFKRELTYWVNLPPHPNVVQAKDADTVNNLLVLEYVYGPPLQEVAHTNPIHPRHFLHWARGIAEGLRFLHIENEFVHRDMRPANVLIDTKKRLTAKISDLGIGKPYNPEVGHHTVIGTYSYMAPEVHRGLTDYRSDIFSYGATLHCLLTGRYAIAQTTKNMRAVLSPSSVVRGVPENLARVVLKCLDREPAQRYANMEEVIEALEPIEEWTVSESLYRRCEEHDYHYFCGNPRPSCPFCLYEIQQKRDELLLAEKLKQREAQRRGDR